MSEILAVALAAMHQDLAQVDTIAQNLANASTPGYRRAVAAARPFGDEVDALTAAPPASLLLLARTAPASGGGVAALQLLVDPHPGTVRMTGQPLDLALEGDGYFEVSTESGPAYTRQGNFGVDAQGRLVTAQGHAVMGRDGEIRLSTRTPVIDASGKITEPDATSGPSALAPGEPVAQLRVVRFEKETELRQLGNGLVAPATDSLAVSASTQADPAQIRQGALENSNVSSMQEMVQLIQTMRHFESMQKVVQGYDDVLSTSIRKLGDLS